MSEPEPKREKDSRVPAASTEPFRPGAPEVEALIAKARKHPLGVDFLLEGELGTVAITFGAHAFTVEAARRHLKVDRS